MARRMRAIDFSFTKPAHHASSAVRCFDTLRKLNKAKSTRKQVTVKTWKGNVQVNIYGLA